jgi:hypothetical protein
MTSTFNGSFMGSRSISRSATRRSAMVAMAAAALFGATAASAQTEAAPGAEARMAAPGPVQGSACPHPVNMTITRNSGAGTIMAGDYPPAYLAALAGSVFNQTAVNKQFGHTFQFRPGKGACCQYQTGKLVVTYKALRDNPANDGTRVFSNGGANSVLFTGSDAAGHIWSSSPTAGQTVTRTFVIPAGMVASGHVSLWAQDDTAVTSATLTITGCCVDATPVQ